MCLIQMGTKTFLINVLFGYRPVSSQGQNSTVSDSCKNSHYFKLFSLSSLLFKPQFRNNLSFRNDHGPAKMYIVVLVCVWWVNPLADKNQVGVYDSGDDSITAN